MSELTVVCAKHGDTPATFLCRHLCEAKKYGVSVGFNMGFDPENPNDIYPDAWCDACERKLEEEGEWNEKSEAFADIKVICSACYINIRSENWQHHHDYFDKLVCQSVSYLKDKQSQFIQEYNIGSFERWDWYQETGKLIFSDKNEVKVEATIQFSGTLCTKSNTWLWSWANESLHEKIKDASQLIRWLGEENGIEKMACALWQADEVDGWEMTAIMAKELKAIGAYRTKNDTGFSYMIITEAKCV